MKCSMAVDLREWAGRAGKWGFFIFNCTSRGTKVHSGTGKMGLKGESLGGWELEDVERSSKSI